MKTLLLNVVAMICFSSCSINPSWVEEHLSYEDFKPDTIDYRAATIKGIPVFFSGEKVAEYYGMPWELKDSCGRIHILFQQGFVFKQCGIYDSLWSLVVAQAEQVAFVSRFDFGLRKDTLKTPQFEFSYETTLKDIQAAFPNSYTFLNYGLGYPEVAYPYWIILIAQKGRHRKSDSESVTLYFTKNKKLALLEYQWLPEYSKEQWDNYQGKLKSKPWFKSED